MARGNARQKIVRDNADRGRLIDGVEQAVVRQAWEVPCYVIVGHHKTPRPNLGAGMQAEIFRLACTACFLFYGHSKLSARTDCARNAAARRSSRPYLPSDPARTDAEIYGKYGKY